MSISSRSAALVAAVALPAACEVRERPPEQADSQAPAEERIATDAVPVWRDMPPIRTVDEEARYDTAWRAAPSVGSALSAALDRTVLPADTALSPPEIPDSLFDIPEEWDDLSADTVWADSAGLDVHLPLGGRVAGPSVLKVQVLLDRAGFSPGVLDGRWGANVERAVFWLQRREGLRPTGRIDSVTLQHIRRLAEQGRPLVATRSLTSADVAGPFTDIPDDVYARADLDCLCYQSPLERLAERAHTTPEALRQLNPGVDFDNLAAGTDVRVPIAGDFTNAGPAPPSPGDTTRTAPAGRTDTAAGAPPTTTRDSPTAPGDTAGAPVVTRIVVSDRGRYLHAYDAAGRLLHHFPATLGSEYNPSPEGRLEVTAVAFEPWFHYQPELLEGADPEDPSTRLPPGPNSPVGTVWIALSREHYGIHGTGEPATIGYVTSSGCVRLTNWDAELLGRLVGPGTVVEFRDVRQPAPGAPGADAEAR